MEKQRRATLKRTTGCRLQSTCVGVSELEQKDRDTMYELFARNFDQTDRDRFENDLAQKQWVLQLIDPITGRLCGFSTQVLLRVPHESREIRVLFSGDTIVDPNNWGDTALIREWGRLVARIMQSDDDSPFYWFLISKGYKTYRFLPVFFREFYPRHDRETSPWVHEIFNSLGEQMFPDQYDPHRGIVVASPDKDRLRPELAHVEPARLSDPHIRYFLDRNPDFARGDELCCLAPLNFDNFTPAGIRLLDPENRPVPLKSRPE